ncbi:hypothetical protein RIF29_41801 [Crotalaria pallida]|uniref:Uncharacterized protein n=1 Tax=Crotalaria pallida TaxID=3830 RepID=A0AAN9HPQ9_CROPI
MESISRETIRPSASTPPNLRVYPLSAIDNILPLYYVPLIYFYPHQPHQYDTNNDDDDDFSSSQFCDKIAMLKKSLSKVLSIYYPLAGRLRDNKSIECNDQGVTFLVTRLNKKLSEILHNPVKALLNPLFPDELSWSDLSSNASLLAIQINFFACGGIAISVCMSHRFGDISTLFNFVNDWATLNRDSCEERNLIFPVLDAGASTFPQGDFPDFPQSTDAKQNTIVSRRFVFEGSKIETLKAMVPSSSSSSNKVVENPTRVQVVIALLYKCIVSALRLTPKNTSFKVSVNLRKRVVPPLHEKSTGNIVWTFNPSNQFTDKKEPLELHELVTEIREGLCEFCDKKIKNFGEVSFVNEYLKKTHSLPQEKEASTSCDISKEKETMFLFTSWCRYSMYEADFGWGKPMWVTTSDCPNKNHIALMDTRDGNGIEVLVNLEEEDMALLECDVELLHYASLSPNRWTHVDEI